MTTPCSKEKVIDDIWKAVNSVKNSQAWKVGFWTMVAITTVALPVLAGNVITNDRLRASEDIRIIKPVDARFTIFSDRQLEIMQDVREIKTLLRSALGDNHR